MNEKSSDLHRDCKVICLPGKGQKQKNKKNKKAGNYLLGARFIFVTFRCTLQNQNTQFLFTEAKQNKH